MMLIYGLQTDLEMQRGGTLNRNGTGFSSYHAADLTALALKVQRGCKLYPDEMLMCRRRIRRYWRQIMYLKEGVLMVNTPAIDCKE